MKDSILIDKLNSLKDIKADGAWRDNNRSILLSQITSGVSREKGLGARLWQKLEVPFVLLRGLPQPVLAVVLIVAFFGSSALSMYAARDARPGETLYLAKKAGEKTQLVFAFSEEKKLKLSLEFAGERAREINRILEEDNDQKDESVVRLVNDFKKEIYSAKERAEKLAREKTTDEPAAEPAADEPAVEGGEEGEQVFTATLGKEEKGISLSEAAPAGSGTEDKTASGTEEVTPDGQEDSALTLVVVGQGGSATGVVDQQAIVDKVEKNISELLENGDLVKTEALNALAEAIDKVGAAQTKVASSAAEVLNDTGAETAADGSGEAEDDGASSSADLSF